MSLYNQNIRYYITKMTWRKTHNSLIKQNPANIFRYIMECFVSFKLSQIQFEPNFWKLVASYSLEDSVAILKSNLVSLHCSIDKSMFTVLTFVRIPIVFSTFLTFYIFQNCFQKNYFIFTITEHIHFCCLTVLVWIIMVQMKLHFLVF